MEVKDNRNEPAKVQGRIKVDSEFILHGYSEKGLRYDPVQTAFSIQTESNGYNNARIMRYYVRRLGEDSFREIVYQQWRENAIDGVPRNVVTALMRKLWLAAGGA